MAKGNDERGRTVVVCSRFLAARPPTAVRDAFSGWVEEDKLRLPASLWSLTFLEEPAMMRVGGDVEEEVEEKGEEK